MPTTKSKSLPAPAGGIIRVNRSPRFGRGWSTTPKRPIRVEIDNEVFLQQRITPKMDVEIYGEVENDVLQSLGGDVDHLTVVE